MSEYKLSFCTHWNSNLLCAIDTETTGLEPGVNELIQIAIVPLTFNYEMNKKVNPFALMIKPELLGRIDPEAEQISKGKAADALQNGMERWTAVQRFEEWFAKLNLAPGKKIIPLGANYDRFDSLFITEWLGSKLIYEKYFRNDSRDVQRVASYLNDVAYWRQNPIPFPKFSLGYLCVQLGVEHIQKHDALSDAIAAAECYRKMLRLAPLEVTNLRVGPYCDICTVQMIYENELYKCTNCGNTISAS